MKTYAEIYKDYINNLKYLKFLVNENPTEEELKIVFTKYIIIYKKLLKIQDFSFKEILYS